MTYSSWKKSISPLNIWGVDYITLQPMKRSVSPPNFSKPVTLSSKAVLKNHKMKNSIALDSKWVELHSKHIIWYALVHVFYNYEEKHISTATAKNILKHTILYVHCVDLLIWSLTQLDFLFYDFSVIYYDFSKLF